MTVYTLQYIVTLIIISLQFLYPFIHLIPNFVQIPLFFIWLTLLNPRMRCFNDILFSKTIVIYLIFASVFLRVLFSGNFGTGYWDPIHVVIAYYQFIVSYSLYLYIKSLSSVRIKKIVTFSLFCIFISLLFSLYYVFFIDPQAIRNTQRDFLWGAGDFQLMYLLAVLVGCITCILKTKLKRMTRFKLLTFLFVGVLTLVKSNLATALVLGITSIVINFILMSKKPKRSKYIGIIILLILTTLREKISLLFITISRWDIFYWTTQKKLVAIANLLVGGEELDTLGSRAQLARQSIDSFLSSPLFGISYSDYGQGIIGLHQQWADDLGRHGIVGFMLIIIVGYFVFLNVLKSTNNKLDRASVTGAWIMYIILGFLNPNMMGALLMVMFTVAPFLSTIRGENIYEKKTCTNN